jgi:iron-sulfur cluster assembly protein
MSDKSTDTAVSKKSKKPLVSMTERAAKEVARVIGENQLPAQTHVRIGAKGGGCSGLTYVVIDKKSSFFMAGTELDFNDGLLDRGFVFKNPAASGSCGCGTSFSV